jgi:hypothetical protein
MPLAPRLAPRWQGCLRDTCLNHSSAWSAHTGLTIRRPRFRWSDCLRAVPQSNDHNFELQIITALSAPRPRLERGTYCLGVRFAVGPDLRVPRSMVVGSVQRWPPVTVVDRSFWHGCGTDAVASGGRAVRRTWASLLGLPMDSGFKTASPGIGYPRDRCDRLMQRPPKSGVSTPERLHRPSGLITPKF